MTVYFVETVRKSDNKPVLCSADEVIVYSTLPGAMRFIKSLPKSDVYRYDILERTVPDFPDEVEIIRLKVSSFCFHDMYEMTKHPRSWFKPKPELQAGTELHVISITQNFYGTFYCCYVPVGIRLEYGCIPTYDIPIGSAEVIRIKED